jgi:hypothetical protein
MTKIYKAPSEIKLPEFNWRDLKASREAERKYEQDLKDWCVNRCTKTNKPTTDVGEIIGFPVADGYARYMVASMKPLELIHIELDDAWSFEYVDKLNAKDVKQKIESAKAMAKIFSNPNV